MDAFIKQIIGMSITNINRICDLVLIDFTGCTGRTISLHIQTFFRFVRDGKILISSDDMYRCAPNCDAESFEWDTPGSSIYDSTLLDYQNILLNAKVQRVQKNDIGDLIFFFENDIQLQIYLNSIIFEEKYRIFDEDRSVEIYG